MNDPTRVGAAAVLCKQLIGGVAIASAQ
jgi:hypothetical protein